MYLLFSNVKYYYENAIELHVVCGLFTLRGWNKISPSPITLYLYKDLKVFN